MRTLTIAALVAATSAALPAAGASGASLPADTTAILSGTPSLLEPLPAPAGDSTTGRATASVNGNYVAFTSSSDGLTPDDDDRVLNVYVKNRETGAVTLASRATGAAGEPAHADCEDPALSDNGNRVAFTCLGRLDPADTNDVRDVYVRDLSSSTTYLASRGSGGQPVGDNDSVQPALDANGSFVVFASEAGNLGAPAVGNGGLRVFRRQIGDTGPTILVSRRPAAEGGGPIRGQDPSVTDDGNRIAFTVPKGDDPPADPIDTNGISTDVYVRDVAADTTVLTSRGDGNGPAGNGHSGAAAIAGDGSAVVFESEATTFDSATDSSPDRDVYRRSLTTRATVLVSVNTAGTKGHESRAPSISSDGNVVAFLSDADALHPSDDDPATDVYVKDLVGNSMRVASRGNGGGPVANVGAGAVALSGDGKVAVMGLNRGITLDGEPRRKSVVARDLPGAETENVSRPQGLAPFRNLGGDSSRADLSRDGRYAVFSSEARGLGLPPTGAEGIFVRDRVTGEVTLVSRADGVDGAPFDDVGPWAISGDGGRVAFTAKEGGVDQVWVRDVAAGRTLLASRADGPGGVIGNKRSSGPALDADGSRVAFTTNATNLNGDDTDELFDVHLRDLDTNQTILVSRRDGAGSPKGKAFSANADINADGTRVAFVSVGEDLVTPGTPPVAAHAYLRDTAAGTTRRINGAPDGTVANGSTNAVSIDESGTRVAFDSEATNLLGLEAPTRKVFVRDFAANTLVLVSRARGAEGAPADGDSFFPVISPDGGHVAFSARAGNLAPGVPAGVLQVYRRDLGAQRTELVSRRSGRDGAPSATDALPGAVSVDGGCVAFGGDAALVGPVSDYQQSFVRTSGADCSPPVYPPDDDGGGPVGGAGGPDGDSDRGPVTGGDARDTTAPVLSGVRLDRRRFRAKRGGAVLRFRSSEAGTLAIRVDRRVRRGRRTRALRAGTITRSVRAGAGRVRLTAKIGRRRLRPGAYRLTVVVRDAAGNRSRAVRLRLTIVRG